MQPNRGPNERIATVVGLFALQNRDDGPAMYCRGFVAILLANACILRHIESLVEPTARTRDQELLHVEFDTDPAMRAARLMFLSKPCELAMRCLKFGDLSQPRVLQHSSPRAPRRRDSH